MKIQKIKKKKIKKIKKGVDFRQTITYNTTCLEGTKDKKIK